MGGSVFSVVAAALLFRHLRRQRHGPLPTATSLSALVSGLTDLGLTGICVRELSVLRGERRTSFARNLLGLRLVLASAGVVLVTAFAFAAYGPLLGIGVLVAGCGMFLQNTQVLLTASLSVRLRLGTLSALELARQLVTAAVIVALVLAGAQLLAFLAVAALVALVMLVPTIALVRGDFPLMPSFDIARWRTLIGPMLTYSAAVLTATVYLRIAIVLVSLLSSARQLGYMSVSYRVVENLFVLPGLMIGSAFPIFAHAAHVDTARFASVISRMFDMSLIVGVSGLALARRGREPGDRGTRRWELSPRCSRARGPGHLRGGRVRRQRLDHGAAEPPPASRDPDPQPRCVRAGTATVRFSPRCMGRRAPRSQPHRWRSAPRWPGV